MLRYNAAGERTYANPAADRLRHELGPLAAAQLRALVAQSCATVARTKRSCATGPTGCKWPWYRRQPQGM